MAVVRIEKVSNFTTMSNYHLDDLRLSLKAIGLMSKMLRLPPDWDYTIEGLSAICLEGKDAIRSAIEELEAAGYIKRRQTHNAAGCFSKNEYVVYEIPPDISPLSGNPTTAEPLSGNPLTENPTQLNTYKPSTNIPPKVPHRGRRECKKAPDHEPEMFARFWKAYPRGEDKQGAIAAWDELSPSRELMFEMAAALEVQKKSPDWQRGVGVPYAVRWLRRRRWEDVKDTHDTGAQSDAPDYGGAAWIT